MAFIVGQEVAIRSGYGYASYRIAVVERITSTGQIVIAGSARRFRADGHAPGNSTDRLVELTNELRATIRHKALVERLAMTKWNTLPLDTLERVVAALD